MEGIKDEPSLCGSEIKNKIESGDNSNQSCCTPTGCTKSNTDDIAEVSVICTCNTGANHSLFNSAGCTEDSEESPADDSDDTSASKISRPRPITLEGKKRKLRTSKDVYDRLTWDCGSVKIKQTVDGEEQELPLDLESVFVGYKDRFLGMCELPFSEFSPGGDIPFHRIYYFRTGGPPVDSFVGKDGEVKVRDDNLPEGTVFIWDRDARTDLVFKSGNSSCLK